MPRPFKCRRINFMPGATYFKPAGIPLRMLAENRLSLEETEAIRLKDLEHLEQEECAAKMNISRPTFQRVLGAARRKIADSIVSGKALRIEGGNYEFAREYTKNTEGNKMKIAVVTDDEITVSQHFGRAPWYEVYTIKNGEITGKEKRAKAGHQQFAGQEQHGGPQGGQHGFGAASQGRHAAMAAAIKDCQYVIAGGMGYGAFENLKIYNIEPIITDVQNAEEAVRLQIQGKLPNLKDRLH